MSQIEEIRDEEKQKAEREFSRDAKRERAPGINIFRIGYGILKDNLLGVASSDIEDLEEGAIEWWKSKKTQESWYGKMLIPIFMSVGFKTFLLVAKVFLSRWIYDVINNHDEPEEEEEEEDEER